MTRETWLTLVELWGFAAVAGGLALVVLSFAGALVAGAALLLAAGIEAVYLANAYGLPAPPVKPEATDDAER